MAAALLFAGGCGTVRVEHGATLGKSADTVPAVQPGKVNAAMKARYRQALAHMQAGQWDDAIVLLEALTDTHGQLAGPWLNLGIARTRTGATEQAREAFETAAARNPRQAEAWNQLGMLHRRGGDHRLAARMYRRAIEADPGYADSHWNLAVLHDRYLPDRTAAAHHLERYRQLTGSDDPQLARWLGELQPPGTPDMTAGANVR